MSDLCVGVSDTCAAIRAGIKKTLKGKMDLEGESSILLSIVFMKK